MNASHRYLLFLALAVSFMTSRASAQIEEHDGFFLRLSGGFGGANTELEEGTEFLKFSGGSGDVNIAIGGIVAENLALHGTIFGWTVVDPDVETELGSGYIEGDLNMFGTGIGLTYYFMPSNLYISGTIGFGGLELNAGGRSGDTGGGFAGDLTLGKEWWVGEQWGIGVAGCFGFHSIPEEGASNNWTGVSFGVRFSATYN